MSSSSDDLKLCLKLLWLLPIQLIFLISDVPFLKWFKTTLSQYNWSLKWTLVNTLLYLGLLWFLFIYNWDSVKVTQIKLFQITGMLGFGLTIFSVIRMSLPMSSLITGIQLVWIIVNWVLVYIVYHQIKAQG